MGTIARSNRVFVSLAVLALIVFAAGLRGRLTAQANPPATGQASPAQPVPSREVSPVTPRGPIRLTAMPPKLAVPEPAANTSDLKARYVGSLAC